MPRTLGSVWLRNTATNQFEIGADYWSIGSNLVVLAAYYEGVLRGIDTITRGVVAVGENLFGMPQISGMMLYSTNPPSVCVDLSVSVRLITRGTPSVEWIADRITLTALNPSMTVTGFTPSDLKVARIPVFRIMNLGSDESSCCVGRVGDANGLGTYPQEVTISDIQTLVTARFIQGTCTGYVQCFAEGDANQSGGANPTCNDITISDIQTLVNHLFIAGPVNAPLKSCL